MIRSAFFGLVAAVIGAFIYYTVTTLTGWEIGLVAILIGYMVGYAIMLGSEGIGGRKYQFMAAALTYFSVGLAYFSLAGGGMDEILAAFITTLTLPVYVIINSFPSGLITGCIIGFGIYQAWQMTAARGATLSEPQKFGDVLETPAASQENFAEQPVARI